MADRMRRVWLPFSSGSALIDAGGPGTIRTDIPFILESEMGRQYESYTLTRLLFRWNGYLSVGTEAVVTLGVIIQPAELLIGSSNPADDPERDWLYHGEFTIRSASDQLRPSEAIVRDIRSQRKSLGMATKMYFYERIRSAVTMRSHVSGRALILMR